MGMPLWHYILTDTRFPTSLSDFDIRGFLAPLSVAPLSDITPKMANVRFELFCCVRGITTFQYYAPKTKGAINYVSKKGGNGFGKISSYVSLGSQGVNQKRHHFTLEYTQYFRCYRKKQSLDGTSNRLKAEVFNKQYLSVVRQPQISQKILIFFLAHW